ncbi:MAG TPA: hypothetical protein VG650_17230, partial [Mycobacteriales bacterium]|nr:hypothetical protein [Mycobacteriales bacterium]
MSSETLPLSDAIPEPRAKGKGADRHAEADSDGWSPSDELELRQAVEEAEADVRALSDVVTALETAHDPDIAAQVALDKVRAAFGWAYGSYWKVDPADQALHFVIESGDAGEEFRKVTLAASFKEGVG